MTALPSYAATPVGRALISEIIDNPPESRLIRDDWGARDTPRYSGKPAAMLRRLRAEWVERELAALDRQFAITHRWDDDAAAAVIGAEQSDALIERVLAEAVSERRAVMTLRQQLIRSLNAKPRLVVSNDSAADWLLRIGPVAKRLNEESKHDGDAA